MKRAFLLAVPLAVFILTTLGLGAQTAGIRTDKKVKQKWSTKQAFMVPESVCYDAERDVLYVSNINGKPTDKDDNGFISKLSTDGKIIERNWVEGLHAPKGMGVFEGTLYVTDIDRIAEIDIEKGEIIRFHVLKEAQFLNDIDIDANGTVYISDMMDTRIYSLGMGDLKIWLDDPILTGPNGLYCSDDYLYIGCKKIVRVDYVSKEIERYAEETGGIDGLKYRGNGTFIFSDWAGNVYLIDKEKAITNIISTVDAEINAADIEYIPEKKLLLVPTFFDNRVVAYELK